jgi:hypothetical protein
MANPGRDIFNMQADDVLSPKRQQEIAQIVEVLKKFQPTKIAVEANGRADKLETLQASMGARVKEQDDFLRSHTVVEMLERMNADSTVTKDVASYFAFVPYGDPDDYAGPDLLAMWYQRNIRIYHNIAALIDSPNDRILVIYGAGHLGWLQQDVNNDEAVKLRKLAANLPSSLSIKPTTLRMMHDPQKKRQVLRLRLGKLTN